MRLSEMVERAGGRLVPGARPDPAIRAVELDSRRCGPGSLFAALPGTRVDGLRFAGDALARGAEAVLAAAPLEAAAGGAPMACAQWIHPQPRRAAGLAASLVQGEPSRGMFVVAITGTNGKTTTAHLVGQLLAHAGARPAVLGTTGHRLAGELSLSASHTTPDAPELQRLLALHKERGGDSVALEASSHALEQERLAGVDVSVAVFTNLTRDHLDYHGDLARYRAAKERLFSGLSPDACAIVNADDPAGHAMGEAARARGARVLTYGIRSRADLSASRLRTDLQGTHLFVSGMGISTTRLWLPLTGRFNVENALAALAAVLVSGASPSNALDGLAAATPAPGRLERIPTGERGFTLLVDYAHTEDALANVCESLRASLVTSGPPDRRGRLIVVFGCGGERDSGKRAPMGAVVDRLADLAIVTSDNPRGEDPERIIADICEGMGAGRAERLVEPDRARAVRLAIAAARHGDVVLLAGKGHERSQAIGSRVVPLDDRALAQEALA